MFSLLPFDLLLLPSLSFVFAVKLSAQSGTLPVQTVLASQIDSMKTERDPLKHPKRVRTETEVYPFAAIVGQAEMKLGLLLNVIDPKIGGVLIMGHRGTGKSTAVRALADLLPLAWRVRACSFGCDPEDFANLCDDCARKVERGERLQRERARVSVVDLPLGATEDRVCGSINIERALTEGVKAFEPGLLARANRGFLYIDEVNLLEDHLVDLLLDVAASARNKVERESVSVEHPARFVLVGSGNPEEGELRPQLLDRFGLHVEIRTSEDLDERVQIVERREAFERNPAQFRASWEGEQSELRRRILRARRNLGSVQIEKKLLRRITELCLHLKVDGHRGELTITRAARALAAFEGRRNVTMEDVERVAPMSLRHRLRRDPLDQTPGGARIEKALEEISDRQGSPESSQSEASQGQSRDSAPHEFQDDDTGGEAGARNEPQEQAPTERGAKLPEAEVESAQADRRGQSGKASASSRLQSNNAKAAYNTRRGRYARSTAAKFEGARVALDATLRAAMPSVRENFFLRPDALRYKLYKRKAGALFIFAVDASGSMALNRIRQAKGALAQLLERSYVRRDHVALLSFRGEGAEILLHPSRSQERARRLLDEIRIGGATPIAAGLQAALRIALRVQRSGRERRIHLLLFTDGRANVAVNASVSPDKTARREMIRRELEELGGALQRARVSIIVVDTQTAYATRDEGRRLAEILCGHYVALPATGKELHL